MRIVRGVAIAAGATLLLAGAAVGPLWAAPPPAPAVPDVVPAEIFGLLFEVCAAEYQPGADEFLEPSLTVDFRVEVAVMRWADERTVPVELDDTQRARIAEINACFADFQVDPEYRGEPQFDSFHRAMHDDYLVRIVVPCLAALGVDNVLPLPAVETERIQWYLRRLEKLQFEDALKAWWECPLVPSYLDEAAFPNPPAGG